MSEAENASAAPADAPAGNWVDAYAPSAAVPYLRMMRADRPIGGWLLALPGLMGLGLAGGAAEWRFEQLAISGWSELVWLVAAFFFGAFIMRGAGCVLNDVVDRDIDGKVARTANRPLPSGQATVRGAVVLLVVLCLAGLAILLTFNTTAVLVGLASAIPVAVYPFMKRITWWPQVFLGIAFSWGALLADAAVTGSIGAPALLLYLSAIVWTVGYDTIYAHQDREDDALIGVRSTALLFAGRTDTALRILYGASVILAGAAGATAGLGVWFYVGLAGFALHLAGQIRRLDIDDPALCLHLFRSNRDAGLILALGFAAGGAAF